MQGSRKLYIQSLNEIFIKIFLHESKTPTMLEAQAISARLQIRQGEFPFSISFADGLPFE